MSVSANMVFIRHSFACHNSIPKLYKDGVIDENIYRSFLPRILGEKSNGNGNIKPINDPELTDLGVDAAELNGIVIQDILNKKFNITTFDMVCCSPLIRCMETAYYFTRNWKLSDTKIYVMPFLRELDESSDDIYSKSSVKRMNTHPAYSIKTIKEQKEYLKSQGILEFFDFRYVEEYPSARLAPGNIKVFTNFFGGHILRKANKKLNVITFTHAGVLKRFAHEGFQNNAGFISKMEYDPSENVTELKQYTSLDKYLQNSEFFSDYARYNTPESMCLSKRCNNICEHLPKTSSSEYSASGNSISDSDSEYSDASGNSTSDSDSESNSSNSGSEASTGSRTSTSTDLQKYLSKNLNII